ncbi:hypothetical protein L7F22_030191 [Adiantum nelumboides]|nr:hypothetical protein [Adiantum nelumboides]
MPLDGCDVLLGIPWLFRVQGILDAYNKITIQSRGKTLILDVDAFVRECIICQKVKFDRQKAPGLLQPLPIPDKPWESIAMDFIFDLPRTQAGNDGIWTIICGFNKQAHFILVRKKIKPNQMARLFLSNIFKYHGMPQSIVSDRDPRMTSLFWRGLFENMGTTLKLSSSFHPQTDGQSEEANSTVLDLLKCYVSEHKGKIKPGFEDKIPSLEVELGCKLSPLMWLQEFYSLPCDAPIASSEAYRAGKIYGMDAASGAAVSALGVIEGDHVLDLCAAPGAKLCMMADQLGNSGTLTGVDIARHRLAACRTMLLKYGLGKSCRLFVADGASFTLLPLHQGVGSIEGESFSNNAVDGALKEWSSRKTRKEKKCEAKLQREKGKADLLFYGNGSGVVGLTKGQLFENCCMIGRNCSENGYDKSKRSSNAEGARRAARGCALEQEVLVDAECTHDGSLKHIRKYEHWGWETMERRVLDHERLASITSLQLLLLTNGFRLLKAGGTLVYSTCSLTNAQNEEVVETFLSGHPNAELVEIEECQKSNWPCENGKLPHTLRFNPISSSTSGLFLAKIKKCL